MYGYDRSGLGSEEAPQRPAEMETLGGPVVWNKSKQMSPVDEVAWHNQERGGMAAQKYTGHISIGYDHIMCCNRGCELANTSAVSVF